MQLNFSVSSLKDHEMIATYCGLRPRSPEFHDYQIRFNKDLSWATLGAIRSTGLTASRSIAEYCAKNLFSNEPYEVGYPQLLSKNISVNYLVKQVKPNYLLENPLCCLFEYKGRTGLSEVNGPQLQFLLAG